MNCSIRRKTERHFQLPQEVESVRIENSALVIATR